MLTTCQPPGNHLRIACQYPANILPITSPGQSAKKKKKDDGGAGGKAGGQAALKVSTQHRQSKETSQAFVQSGNRSERNVGGGAPAQTSNSRL